MCSISNSFPLTLSDLKLDETSTSQLVSVSLKFICALALNCLLSLSFSPYSTDVIKSTVSYTHLTLPTTPYV